MRVLSVIDTRPEAIKMAMVARGLDAGEVEHRLCATGQHREMLDSVFADFDLHPRSDRPVARGCEDPCYGGSFGSTTSNVRLPPFNSALSSTVKWLSNSDWKFSRV